MKDYLKFPQLYNYCYTSDLNDRLIEMRILGIVVKPSKGFPDSVTPPKIEFENQYFKLFSDIETTQEISNNKDVFNRIFGYQFNKTSNAHPIDLDFEGSYFAVTVDSLATIRVTTDPNCRRDLYFTETEEFIAFSNSLAVLEELPGLDLVIDQISLAHSLSIYGNRPPKKNSYYKNIKRLGFRQCIVIENQRLNIINGELEIFKTSNPISERHFLSKYSQTFLEALEKRSSNSQNIIYFSSGWDSTAIAAGLVKLKGKENVKCVIGEMKYSKSSQIINKFEIERAVKICDYLGISLDVIKFDYSDQLPNNFDEILNFLKVNQLPSLTAINHFLLAEYTKKIAQDNHSVFAGEMSDGAHNLGFAQYTSIFHPNSIDFREYSDKMRSYLFGPSFLNYATPENLSKDPVWKLFSEKSDIQFETPAIHIKERFRQFLISFFLRNTRLPFVPKADLRLLTNTGSLAHEKNLTQDYFIEYEDYLYPENLYSIYLTLYNSFHWQGSTVNSLELSGEYFGLKVTNPYHDKNLIQLLQGMPENYGRGLDLKPTKYPVKWMLENTLNYDLSLNSGLHSYLYDEDPNFSHSEEILYNSSFVKVFKAKIKTSELFKTLDGEIFDKNFIDALIKQYLNEQKVESKDIGNLLAICMHSMIF